jgi:hypothetical protein
MNGTWLLWVLIFTYWVTGKAATGVTGGAGF